MTAGPTRWPPRLSLLMFPVLAIPIIMPPSAPAEVRLVILQEEHRMADRGTRDPSERFGIRSVAQAGRSDGRGR